MKSFSHTNILLIVMLGLVTISGSFSAGKFVSGQQTLDIKTPGGNEAFGGEKKGTVELVP
jgi:hypothetical protein